MKKILFCSLRSLVSHEFCTCRKKSFSFPVFSNFKVSNGDVKECCKVAIFSNIVHSLLLFYLHFSLDSMRLRLLWGTGIERKHFCLLFVFIVPVLRLISVNHVKLQMLRFPFLVIENKAQYGFFHQAAVRDYFCS